MTPLRQAAKIFWTLPKWLVGLRLKGSKILAAFLTMNFVICIETVVQPQVGNARQRAYFYKSGVLVGVSQLSTGREGLNTPYGHFSVIQKDVNHASTLFGDYVDSAGNVVVPNVDVTKDPKPPGTHFRGTPMPYFMRIVSGTGLHAGYLPGYPASHGCIRMPEFMAENFFKSVSLGTPVTIAN